MQIRFTLSKKDYYTVSCLLLRERVSIWMILAILAVSAMLGYLTSLIYPALYWSFSLRTFFDYFIGIAFLQFATVLRDAARMIAEDPQRVKYEQTLALSAEGVICTSPNKQVTYA